MSKAGANPEVLGNMVQILTRFIDLQDNVVSNLKSQYGNVGSDWDDQKYEELGAVLDEVTAAISGTNATLSTCITKIQLLQRIMEDYLNQHLG